MAIVTDVKNEIKDGKLVVTTQLMEELTEAQIIERISQYDRQQATIKSQMQNLKDQYDQTEAQKKSLSDALDKVRTPVPVIE